MDMFNPLPFVVTVLSVFDICNATVRHRITGKDEQRLGKDETRLIETLCGQEMYLSSKFRKHILILYDGAYLKDTCTIHIKQKEFNLGMCIEFNDTTFKQDDKLGCWNFLRFYFGENNFKDSTKFYSCPGNYQTICDLHSTAHIIFNQSHILDKEIRFQISVSLSKHFHRRSAGDSWSSWSSSWSQWEDWSSWDSWSLWSASKHWSSWSDDYEKQKEERQKKNSTVIGLSIFGVLVAAVCYICFKCGPHNSEDISDDQSQASITSRQDRRSMDSPPPQRTYTPVASGVNSTQSAVTSDYAGVRRAVSTGYIDEYSVPAPGDTSDTEDNVETITPLMPSASEEQNTGNTSLDAPPPSYASLFPNKQRHSIDE